MKHKIRVWRGSRQLPLWYVRCLGCPWEAPPDAESDWYGRPTWDGAFALGIAHQQNINGRGECG